MFRLNKFLPLTVFMISAALCMVGVRTHAAGILGGESGKDPVVLVHGYSGSVLGQLTVEGYWIFIGGRLELDGYDTYKIALGDAALQDIRTSAAELRDFVNNVRARTGKAKVDIVCHSEGGLVAKYYIKNLGGYEFVDDLVTIATPHRGTSVAAIGPGEAGRQMEVRSDFLRDLDSDWDFPGDVDYTAIHSNHDEMVFPPQNGFFEGAVNMNINLVGHAGIMVNEQVYRMVKGAVSSDLADNHSAIPVEILNSAMTTRSANVSLRIRKANHYYTGADMEEMRISNNQFLGGADWRKVSGEVNWQLDSAMDGLKAVYVQFRREGSLLELEMTKESPVYVDYIFYDSTAPWAVLDEAPEATLDRNITVKVSASDNSDNFKKYQVWNAMFAYGIEDLGVKEMKVSADPAFTGAAWQPFAGSASVDLGPGPGMKTVYFKVRDGAGNESAVASKNVRVVDPDAADMGLISEGDSDPVVLVHGYGGSVAGDVSAYINWIYIYEKLEADGFDAYRIALSEGGLADVTKSAEELRAFVAKTIADTGAAKVDIVCHSEGGLVARYYVKNLGGSDFVDDLVTISTPHRGTTVAHIGPGMAARQMEVASDFLQNLNSGDALPGDVEYTALFSHGDEVVLPGRNGFFDGAVNINYMMFGHAGILFHPDPYKVVKNTLANRYIFSHGGRPVEIMEAGMSTAAGNVTVKLRPCNHYAPQVPVTEMMVAKDAAFHGASWTPVSDSVVLDISGENEDLLGVHVKFRGADGVESPSYADYIEVDRTGPSGSIEIASVDADNNTMSISINSRDNMDRYSGFHILNILEAYGITGMGVREMRVGGDGDFAGAAWEPVADTKTYSFAPGAGKKNVYAQLRDAAGNVSEIYTASTYVFDRVNGYMAMEEGKDPVVFVHGYSTSILGDVSAYLGWAYYVERMKARGYSTHVITLGNAGMQDIAVSADELKDFIGEVLKETGASKVDIVSHSEGGLVSRYFVKYLGGAAFVDDLVTISTPNRGTVLAGVGFDDAAKQMTVGSAFIENLNRGDTTPGIVDYTSIFSNNDEVILPAQNSFYAGAVNINTNFYEHVTILVNDEVFNNVLGALSLDVGRENAELPIYIQKDQMVTASPDVTLVLNYYNHSSPQYPPGEMMVSNDKFFRGAEWQPVAASMNWTLEGEDGLKGVYVKYRAAETGDESPVYVDYILLDREAPRAGVSARPADGADDTAVVTVSISDNADTWTRLNPIRPLESYGIPGVGAVGMMLWNSPDFTGAAWEPPAGTKVWPLLEGDGGKTIYARFKDAAGNVSDTYSVKVAAESAHADIEEVVDEIGGVVSGVIEVAETEIVDVNSTIIMPEGWSLVYVSGSLPGAPGERVEMLFDSLRDVFDLTKMARPGEVVNLPEQGRTLWVYVDKEVREKLSFRAARTAGRVFALEPGWNAIGTPGFSDVPVENIKVKYGAEDMSLADAESAGLLIAELLTYQGDHYEAAGSLIPFRAYFIFALQPCVLDIP